MVKKILAAIGVMLIAVFMLVCPASAATDGSYTELNGNVPSFSKSDLTTKAFETYSELDELGRCGVAYANVCTELMPTTKRESIGMIKPSGWQTAKYEGLVDGNYLYNRCHLIAFMLAGENANEKNLITGTRYMNVEGMLPFENKVADYVKKTNNHVLYRVTPDFEGDNLVASGVQIEALSVEDNGKGVKFNVYCYNVQPGIEIDYSNGDNKLVGDTTYGIKLNYSKYSLKVGESRTFKATLVPSGSKSKITWFTSNRKVATVDSKGKVTAKGIGTAVITAKTENGKKAKCTITVKKKEKTK